MNEFWARTVVAALALCVAPQVSLADPPTKQPRELADCLKLKRDDIRACVDALDACAAGPDSRAADCRRQQDELVKDRFAAEKMCALTGALSECFKLSDKENARQCAARCTVERLGRYKPLLEQAQDACFDAYAESGGTGKFSCEIEQPLALSMNLTALKSDLQAAIKAGAYEDMDRLFGQLDTEGLRRAVAICSKDCQKTGPAYGRALSQKNELVVAYKLCMVQADSRLEARKLAAYEQDLYCAYLRKADERCRSSSKCDWLEGAEEAECVYASYGVSQCEL